MPGSPWLEKNKGRDQAPFPSRRLRGWVKPFGIRLFVSLSGNGAAPASSPWDRFFHRKILCAPCSGSGMWLWAFGQIPLLLQRKTGTRRRRNPPRSKSSWVLCTFLKDWDLCPVLPLFFAQGKPARKGWSRLSQKFGNGSTGMMLRSHRITAASRIHPWLCLRLFSGSSPLPGVIPIPTSLRNVP